jgi:hypothetical protein
MAKDKIFRVLEVKTSIQKKNPPILAVVATGLVSSTGWSKPSLEPWIGPVDPPPTIADFDFVAEPPDGTAAQVMTAIEARFNMDPMPAYVTHVCVHANTNNIRVLAGHSARDTAAADPVTRVDGGDKPFPLG